MNAQDLRGTSIANGAELESHQSYTEGNAKLVTQFYQRLLNKDQVRVCYFGDHFWSDCWASSTHQTPGQQHKWDSIAVCEEFYWLDQEPSEGMDPLLNDMEQFWGRNFFFDTAYGRQIKNYFVAEMESVSRYAVPMIKNINRLYRR